MTDVMKQSWCCLCCSSKLTFGDFVTRRGKPYIYCPKCGSADIHSINKPVVEVSKYVGQIGTIN